MKQEQKQKQEVKEKKEIKKKQREKKRIIDKKTIRIRLFNHFLNHIGKEDSTNREEIFQAVTGINPHIVDSFKRFYWWVIIEKEIRKLRKNNESFIIKRRGNYFVLKEQNESNYFKNTCNRAIKGMENAQERADEWVTSKKWETMKKNFKEEEVEKPKPIREEKIETNIEKTKKKVVKLWKGEKE